MMYGIHFLKELYIYQASHISEAPGAKTNGQDSRERHRASFDMSVEIGLQKYVVKNSGMHRASKRKFDMSIAPFGQS